MLIKKLIHSETGFSFLGVPIMLTFFAVLLLTLSQLDYSTNYLTSVNNIKGVALAKGGDDNGGSSNSGSSNSGSGSSETSSNSGSSNSGSSNPEPPKPNTTDTAPTSINTNSGSTNSTIKTEVKPLSSIAPVRIRTEENSEKQKTEIKFSEEEKIKTKIEKDRTRIDVYQGGVKVRYETRDGRTIIKAETEAGEEIPEQELFKVVERVDKSGIKVATSGGEILVTKNSITARSSFPIQVDLATNQLIASTPAGVKILTTLPDQAVQNMLAANVISRLDPKDLANKASIGELKSVSDIISLGERNSLPVYEINGLKEHKLLGFIPVTTELKAIVSAETGELIDQEQSILAKITALLSL